jgi:hypothetical protein
LVNNNNIVRIIIDMSPSTPDPENGAPATPATYSSRAEALQLRVNDAATVLFERGVPPTVARVRAALRGGSPNDLAPALRHWKERVLPALDSQRAHVGARSAVAIVPPVVADLCSELWQRALAAAAVDLKGGPTARQVAARTEEAHALRLQLSALRDELQRDALAYGELRAQSARHEAIAASALSRARDADKRERELLRELGSAQQRIAEIEAVAEHLRVEARARPGRARRLSSKKKPPKRSPKPRPGGGKRITRAALRGRARGQPAPIPTRSARRRRKGRAR